MATSSIPASVNSAQESNKKAAQDLGKALASKDKDYKTALASGDQSKIGAAKLDRDKAEENYMGFLTTMNKEHDMIMQIIAMVGR